MENKKSTNKNNELYSVKSQSATKVEPKNNNLLYGMTLDQYNEGVEIHFKCFNQILTKPQ